jgi:hypothetical protein
VQAPNDPLFRVQWHLRAPAAPCAGTTVLEVAFARRAL